MSVSIASTLCGRFRESAWLIVALLAACQGTRHAATAEDAVALDLQSPAPSPADDKGSDDAVELRVGHAHVDEPWFHNQFSHMHGERVEIKQFVDSDGWTRLTIRSLFAMSGTKLRFSFRPRERSKPEVTVDGTWHVDRVMKGQSPTGPLSDVRAHLLVSRTEWGKGWPMKCVFAVSARAKDTPVLLSGAFVVDAE